MPPCLANCYQNPVAWVGTYSYNPLPNAENGVRSGADRGMELVASTAEAMAFPKPAAGQLVKFMFLHSRDNILPTIYVATCQVWKRLQSAHGIPRIWSSKLGHVRSFP